MLGPIATCLEDCELFLRTVVNAGKPWEMDPYCLRLPWKTVESAPKQSYTIGVMEWDGLVRPHPPVQRVLREAATKLSAAGFQLKEWKPYKHAECWEIISSLYFPDNGIVEKQYLEASGEPVQPLTRWILHDNPNSKARSVTEHLAVVA